MKLKKLAILISGRGSNLEAILNGVKKGLIKAEIPIVISNKDNVRGLEIAREFGVKSQFVNPKDFKSREDYDKYLVELIKSHNVDYVILAGYMKILTDYFIDSFENRIINIHPSLIPSFKGLKAQKQALEFGAKFTGCTVHFVSKELDSGPVIVQAVVPVLPEDTEESLSNRILKMEHRIYPQAVKWLVDDRVEIKGRNVIVKGANYGTLPVNPELEDF